MVTWGPWGSEEWHPTVRAALDAVRSKRPLVHHITNEVTAEASANAVLSLGGSAVMARDPGEVDRIVEQAAALVLNLGTLTRDRIAAAERAQRVAIRFGCPMVLDPVGAGTIPGRDRVALRLLWGPSWMVMCLNATELSGVMRTPVVSGRGVDADRTGSEEELESVTELARRCADTHEVVVAVTGPVDVVTDGQKVVHLRGGHPWLTRVTGTGCMVSSVIGAVLGAYHDRTRLDSILEAAVAGLAVFNAAAAWAAEACGAPDVNGTAGERRAHGDEGAASDSAVDEAEGVAGDPAAGDPEAGDPEASDLTVGSGEVGAEGTDAPAELPAGLGLFRARLMDALFHIQGEHVEDRIVYRDGVGKPIW